MDEVFLTYAVFNELGLESAVFDVVSDIEEKPLNFGLKKVIKLRYNGITFNFILNKITETKLTLYRLTHGALPQKVKIKPIRIKNIDTLTLVFL